MIFVFYCKHALCVGVHNVLVHSTVQCVCVIHMYSIQYVCDSGHCKCGTCGMYVACLCVNVSGYAANHMHYVQ